MEHDFFHTASGICDMLMFLCLLTDSLLLLNKRFIAWVYIHQLKDIWAISKLVFLDKATINLYILGCVCVCVSSLLPKNLVM